MTDLKTKDVHWDLSGLYTSISDPRIDTDAQKLITLMQAFNKAYKGKLESHLGEAIQKFADIEMLEGKIGTYLSLRQALKTDDAAVKTKSAELQLKLSAASGEYMEFFAIEMAHLPDEAIEAGMADPVVKKHRPWIDQIRIRKPFMLSEEVESALTKRGQFGPSSWHEFYEEFSADLAFDWSGEQRSLEQMLHVLSESKDAAERARALQVVHAGLGGTYEKYAAETLWNIVGENAVEQRERGYRHPMQGRNLSNQVSDAVVDALHSAVLVYAAPLAQRFYRLKAAHLGTKTLRWSDRNAPMPFADKAVVPFDEGMRLVLSAYESFSPTLARLVRESAEHRRIDAPQYKGKQGGAFNATQVLPGGVPVSWTLLNYLGSSRDVATLAHELGHGVHGLLAGEAQGVLMYHAPIAYCETASVFGEMVTFEHLKNRLLAAGDRKSYLTLLMGKLDDIINTVVRQIGFSNFERRLYGMNETYTSWETPRKRSHTELSDLWGRTLRELYGEDGDVFTYVQTERLWTYIPHFHFGFYVYGYAFGELFVHSLYAKRAQFGGRFEPLYLDLLRSGATKDAIVLMEPFGLDPRDQNFWKDGISASIGTLLAEAEELSKDLGVSIL